MHDFFPHLSEDSPAGSAAGPVILGLESSCDDTAAAVWDGSKIRANLLAGQEVHRQYGGVVPELASRDHEKHIVPLLQAALSSSGLEPGSLDAIAFTRGPGLLGSLLVGASFAKALAWGWGIPLIGVHHMKAHVLAHFIEPPFPPFPFLCLTVSGGHTQIVRVDGPLHMTVLGQTLDDAAGEAFDKCGKLLGLDYPAGPLLDRLARQGDPGRFAFARPDMPGLDYSFSGLKTSVLYFLRDQTRVEPDFVPANLADLCASIQASIVHILLHKLALAAEQSGLQHLALAGGVSANSGLRQGLQQLADQRGWAVYLPDPVYCTDNAAMIARAGAFLFEAGQRDTHQLSVEARLGW
jgi:N6-L-threonylcarbamoyladenine synthase